MRAYIYQADIFCEDCGKRIRQELDAPANVADEASYDSDEYPKGPYPEGGGEADSPHHCASGPDCINAIYVGESKVGVPLENPLTADGVQYVKDSEGEVADYWRKMYQDMGYEV